MANHAREDAHAKSVAATGFAELWLQPLRAEAAEWAEAWLLALISASVSVWAWKWRWE
jgi:hypothetical protein